MPDIDAKLLIWSSLCQESKAGQFCNALALIKEDTRATTEMETAAEEKFTELGCTLEDACGYCEPEENTLPAEVTAMKRACNKPLECPEDEGVGGSPLSAVPATTTTTTTTRGPPPKRPQTETQKDFDSEASFIGQLMNIPEKYRQASSHTPLAFL